MSMQTPQEDRTSRWLMSSCLSDDELCRRKSGGDLVLLWLPFVTLEGRPTLWSHREERVGTIKNANAAQVAPWAIQIHHLCSRGLFGGITSSSGVLQEETLRIWRSRGNMSNFQILSRSMEQMEHSREVGTTRGDWYQENRYF